MLLPAGLTLSAIKEIYTGNNHKVGKSYLNDCGSNSPELAIYRSSESLNSFGSRSFIHGAHEGFVPGYYQGRHQAPLTLAVSTMAAATTKISF